jgi:hypothetical protein
MDYSTMVHYERHGTVRDNRDLGQTLEAYDTDLACHYTDTGRVTTADSWGHDMDKKFDPQLRDNLRRELKSQGFDFR